MTTYTNESLVSAFGATKDQSMAVPPFQSITHPSLFMDPMALPSYHIKLPTASLNPWTGTPAILSSAVTGHGHSVECNVTGNTY